MSIRYRVNLNIYLYTWLLQKEMTTNIIYSEIKNISY